VRRSSHGVTQGDEESIGWKTNRLELGLEGEKRGWGRQAMNIITWCRTRRRWRQSHP
jgi:hypothetical protein